MNETMHHKSWLSKNRIWLYPSILLLVAGAILFSNSKLGENVGDFTKAYADKELHEKAIKIAQENEEVKLILGKLEPLDKLAIFEGSVLYTENDNSVELHSRIIGSKEKGKIDIYADRKENAWEYKKINIRLKNPKRTIEILKN